jgi:hypothetical protein
MQSPSSHEAIIRIGTIMIMIWGCPCVRVYDRFRQRHVIRAFIDDVEGTIRIGLSIGVCNFRAYPIGMDNWQMIIRNIVPNTRLCPSMLPF